MHLEVRLILICSCDTEMQAIVSFSHLTEVPGVTLVEGACSFLFQLFLLQDNPSVKINRLIGSIWMQYYDVYTARPRFAESGRKQSKEWYSAKSSGIRHPTVTFATTTILVKFKRIIPP